MLFWTYLHLLPPIKKVGSELLDLITYGCMNGIYLKKKILLWEHVFLRSFAFDIFVESPNLWMIQPQLPRDQQGTTPHEISLVEIPFLSTLRDKKLTYTHKKKEKEKIPSG